MSADDDRWRKRSTRDLRVSAVVASATAVFGLAGCSTLTVSAKTADDSGASPTGGRHLASRTVTPVVPPSVTASPVAPTPLAPTSRPASPRAAAVPDARLRPNGKRLTISGSGDILIHNSLSDQAKNDGSAERYDFAPMLSGAKARVSSADFAICHLETQFSDPAVVTEFPHLYVRPELARGVKATGFDECDTASNWSLDKGPDGIKRTLDALDAAGVGHTGTARSAAEAATPKITNVKGVPVAHLAYAWDFNGERPPADRPWEANLIDPDQVIADAKKARAAGARIVVVSLHMGDPDSHEISDYQRSVAQRVTKSGQVDLIIGHNSHQVQPIEMINGVWVVFGHGNLISGQYDDWVRNREGIISQFEFAQRMDGRFAVTRAQAFPILDTSSPHAIHDLVASWPKEDPPQRWVDAYNRTKETVLAHGAGTQGLVVPDHR